MPYKLKKMKIKLSEIEIPESDPFLNDALKREENVEVLMQLISTLSGPFVLAIDSEWGTGKTTFLKMWMQQLSNQKIPFLYFNAWENDFSENALVSLIGEIESQISTLCIDSEKQTKAREHLTKIKKVGSSLIRKSLPVAIKIATSGILDIEKAYEEEISKLAESYAKDSIEKYEKSKSNISIFKDRLQKFVQDVINSKNGEKFPLLFFIDELDRCRPNYALELLEKIKHLFNIEGLVFVLAIDKNQIGNSIKSLYGQGMNVDGYLRRFLDLDYRLPSPVKKIYCSTLFDRFGIKDYLKNRTSRDAPYEEEHFVETFSELSDIFGFSLRVQEQCFSQFCIALRTTPPDYKLCPTLLAGLICIKAASPELYRDFVSENVDATSIINFIGQKTAGQKFLYSDEGMILEVLLMVSKCRRGDLQSAKAPYKKMLQDNNISEHDRKKSERILDLFNYIQQQSDYGLLDYLSKKIEISEQFSTE